MIANFLSNCIKKLHPGSTRRGQRHSSRAKIGIAPSCRPRVELLEDRQTPTISDGLGSGGSIGVIVAPIVIPSTAALQTTAPSLQINGSGFDTITANDSVTFNNGVQGTVIGATPTSLTVNLTGLPSLAVGTALNASVTVDGAKSGNPVQVATIASSATPAQNVAFVTNLYTDFLHRAGNTSSPTDAGYWVKLLNNNTMTQSQVANAIIHSTEGSDVLVDGLYEQILHRQAAAPELAYFVNELQHNGTVEQVVTQMVTSQAFTNQYSSNTNYVQALYIDLLGRNASSVEGQYWVAQVPTLGRAGVAEQILGSSAFRTQVVDQYYGDPLAPTTSLAHRFYPLLHRTVAPPLSEIAYWVSSTQDILSIATAFAQSPAYFNKS